MIDIGAYNLLHKEEDAPATQGTLIGQSEIRGDNLSFILQLPYSIYGFNMTNKIWGIIITLEQQNSTIC